MEPNLRFRRKNEVEPTRGGDIMGLKGKIQYFFQKIFFKDQKYDAIIAVQLQLWWTYSTSMQISFFNIIYKKNRF